MTTSPHRLSGSEDSWLAGLTGMVEIGRGGQATVYRAHHIGLGRTVAVKRLDGHLVGRDRLRFDRECDALRTLGGHPNICGLIECRLSEDGRAAMVLDHHARGSIRGLLEAGPLGWPDAFRIGASLAGALETSHRAGILHRDVTPSNVLIDDTGCPVLADFGLARRGESLTRTGELRATIEHAPPEAFGGADPEPSTDIYSLASTIYELIAGHAPLAKDSPTALTLIARLTSESPEDIEGVPMDVMGVLARGLAKDPLDRFATAAATAMAFNESLGRHGEQRAVVHVDGPGRSSHTIMMHTQERFSAPTPHVTAERDGSRAAPTRRPHRIASLLAAAAIAIAGFVFVSGQGPFDVPQRQELAVATTDPVVASEITVQVVETTAAPAQSVPEPAPTTAPPVTPVPSVDTTDPNGAGGNDGDPNGEGGQRGNGGRGNRGN